VSDRGNTFSRKSGLRERERERRVKKSSAREFCSEIKEGVANKSKPERMLLLYVVFYTEESNRS